MLHTHSFEHLFEPRAIHIHRNVRVPVFVRVDVNCEHCIVYFAKLPSIFISAFLINSSWASVKVGGSKFSFSPANCAWSFFYIISRIELPWYCHCGVLYDERAYDRIEWIKSKHTHTHTNKYPLSFSISIVCGSVSAFSCHTLASNSRAPFFRVACHLRYMHKIFLLSACVIFDFGFVARQKSARSCAIHKLVLLITRFAWVSRVDANTTMFSIKRSLLTASSERPTNQTSKIVAIVPQWLTMSNLRQSTCLNESMWIKVMHMFLADFQPFLSFSKVDANNGWAHLWKSRFKYQEKITCLIYQFHHLDRCMSYDITDKSYSFNYLLMALVITTNRIQSTYMRSVFFFKMQTMTQNQLFRRSHLMGIYIFALVIIHVSMRLNSSDEKCVVFIFSWIHIHLK